MAIRHGQSYTFTDIHDFTGPGGDGDHPSTESPYIDSKGNLFLLVFGLGLSIPFVVFTSNLLSMLMDKYPILVYIGAAVLGRVGGEMLITDPFIIKLIQPSKFFEYGVEIFFTIGVLVAGKIWIKWKISREEQALEPPSPQETLISSKKD